LIVLAVLLTVDGSTFPVTLLLIVGDELFLLVFPPNRLEIMLVKLVTSLTLFAMALPIAAGVEACREPSENTTARKAIRRFFI